MAQPTKVFEGSREELVRAIVDCLNDAGFPVSTPRAGIYAWEAPKGIDFVAYSWAEFECRNQVGDIPSPPLNDHNLEILYRTELKVAACVRAFGIDVPEAPTFEAYKSQRLYPSGELWFPLMTLSEKDPRFYDISAKCDAEKMWVGEFVK